MLRPLGLPAAALLALAPGTAPQTGSQAPRPEAGEATIALFAVREGAGEAPLEVRFVDRSFGEITSWSWDFGDGHTSPARNPTHVYGEAGLYDVRLTIRGPHGTDTLTKPGAVVVRSCLLGSARDNRVAPLERDEDFVPVTGDDSLGFYSVYSGKAVGPDNPRLDNNVGMFVFPLANGEVLLFGSGYGDKNSFVEPTEDAAYDVRRVDAVIRFCLGLDPLDTPIHFVAPHGHIDHINADCIRELRRRGYPIAEIVFHNRDATWAKSMPGWSNADRAVFRSLRNETERCQEELLAYASPLGKIWFFLREGHTPGSIDLVLDVQNDPLNRFVVRGSGESYGSCPVPGVREAIDAHGNTLLGAPPPLLLALGPGSGSAFGGTEVLVSGQGFAAPLAGLPQVFFDGAPGATVEVLSDDALRCRAPPGFPGEAVDVRVLNRNGQALLENGFAYRPLPTLTGVTPPRGLASGGTRVTLSGSGFLGSAPGSNAVLFGGVPATAVQALDDRTLQCTTPPHADGAVRVVFTCADGSAELASGFRYDPVIDLRSVSPTAGTGLGGTRVQLSGSAFAFGATLPEVFFGPARASAVVRLSDTLLECTTPAGASGSAVDVRVSGENGSDTLSGAFRYFQAPRVSAVEPASSSADGGVEVTLTGLNFTRNDAGPNRVKFGTEAATGVVTLSDGTLRCVVPAGVAGARVDVFVTNANGTGRLPEGYRYHRAPLLVSLTPAGGPRAGETLVTLHGAAFLETGAGPATVLFGGLPAQAVTVNDDTSLTCRAPAFAGKDSVDVEVANANGRTVLVGGYRYVTRPVVAAVEPPSGPARGGNAVTLRGSGFLAPGAGATVVRFGKAEAMRVRVLDDSTLTCEAPFGLPGASVDVQLTSANGSARLAAGYRYLVLPVIGSVSPISGRQIGGTRVTITGAGFTGAGTPSVRFGRGEALDVFVRSDRSLDCTTPPGPAGAVEVSVQTRGGTALLREGFVYGSSRPTLTELVPAHGPSLGGTTVELHGSNFLASLAGTNSVLFGGVAASGIVALNDTRIRCVVPGGAPGSLVDVVVSNANGSITRLAAYRYHLQPALAGVTPAQGRAQGGLLVTLHGGGFALDEAGPAAVRFGAEPADEIQVLDDATLTCRVPAGTSGSVVDVVLVNANGSALLEGGFRYLSAPTLVSVTPASGAALGGTSVLLGGTGFQASGGPITVRFGASAATEVSVLDDSMLRCVTPAGPAGASVDVVLENASGAATLGQAYRYHAGPAIAALSPQNGPAAGGTAIVLSGSGFTADGAGPNAVTFGAKAARSITTVDDTRVRAITPLGTPGTSVDVVLSNANGSARVALGFRYNALPTLASLEPPGASALGGIPVTLRGSGFQKDGAGVNSVVFGSVTVGSVSVLDDQTLSCLAPAGAAGTDVVVTLSNRNGAALATLPFRYHSAPRIDALVPAHAFSGGGAWIEVRGAGWLADSAGLNTVLFGAAAATEVTVVDDSVLRCRVPAGVAGPVTVTVDNANGEARLVDGFYYDWAPTLTGFQPASGTSLGGTEVLLTGGGFATPGAGTLSVRFGSAAATGVRVQDGKNLLCNAPAGPAGTSVNVVVSNSHGSASLGGYRYHPRPTITSVDPAQGPPEGGTLVTLHGTGFSANSAGAPTVRFDSASATGVTVIDDTTVRCLAPPGPSRTAPTITLTSANGSASFADGFRWLTRDPGDLDDDGIGDALLSGADAVYLFFGQAAGLGDESTLSADLVVRTGIAGTDFGRQVTSGDLNSDGVADLVVGAPLDDAAGADAGAVFVFFGPLVASPTARMAGSANATFRGAAAGDNFGASVVVRDVTGDGTGDLLVGAPLNDTAGSNSGAVYVYRGSATLVSRTTAQATVRLLAAGSGDSFGAALAAGDVSGDGRADVLVGAPLRGTGTSGGVYAFRGGAALVSATATDAFVRLEGDDAGDQFGTSVAAGDFDGDGTADLLAGAPEARYGSAQGGAVYFFRGGAALASGSADDATARLESEGTGDRLGSVLGLGDADGDGRLDLLAGAPLHDVPSSSCGRAYLVLGGTLSTGAIADRADAIVSAEGASGDQMGAALALADLDGDGLDDLLVGAPFSNGGGSDSGRVHVFLGAELAAARSAGADDATYTGASAGLGLGREVGGAR